MLLTLLTPENGKPYARKNTDRITRSICRQFDDNGKMQLVGMTIRTLRKRNGIFRKGVLRKRAADSIFEEENKCDENKLRQWTKAAQVQEQEGKDIDIRKLCLAQIMKGELLQLSTRTKTNIT